MCQTSSSNERHHIQCHCRKYKSNIDNIFNLGWIGIEAIKKGKLE